MQGKYVETDPGRNKYTVLGAYVALEYSTEHSGVVVVDLARESDGEIGDVWVRIKPDGEVCMFDCPEEFAQDSQREILHACVEVAQEKWREYGGKRGSDATCGE